MRILSNKWHGKGLVVPRYPPFFFFLPTKSHSPLIFSVRSPVYAGLAILNPSAKAQVRQYSLSVAALFKLMIQEKETEFVARIQAVNACL